MNNKTNDILDLQPEHFIAIIKHYIKQRYNQDIVFSARDIKTIFHVGRSSNLHEEIITKLLDSKKIVPYTTALYVILPASNEEIRKAHDKYYEHRPQTSLDGAITKLYQYKVRTSKSVVKFDTIYREIFGNLSKQYVHRLLNELMRLGYIRRAVNNEGYTLWGKYEILVNDVSSESDETDKTL